MPTDPRWPDGRPSDTDVLEQLHALMFAFRGELQRLGREAQAPVNPMEVRALLHVAHHPGTTASDLVRHSGRDKAQVTRLIQQLEQAGLLRREADAADRRQQRLYATEAGEQLHRELRQRRDALGRRLLAVLSADEQVQLGQLLARLREGLGGDVAGDVAGEAAGDVAVAAPDRLNG